MLRLLWSWVKRGILAALIGVGAMTAAMTLFLSKLPSLPAVAQIKPPQAESAYELLSFPYFWLLIASGVFFALHFFFRFRKLTFDPTWAERLQERFDKLELDGHRSNAARILKECRGHLTEEKNRIKLKEIEPVLDFFEDLGFFVSGDQISPEVAHHYFYHWLRGYFLTARHYIQERYREEPKAYQHIEPLFNTLRAKEYFWNCRKRSAEKRMTMEEQDEFLNEETDKERPTKRLKRKPK